METDAKYDILNTFDLDKQYQLEVAPPLDGKPPLCIITQPGKEPILTTDFYFTNKEPKLWVPLSASKNMDSPPASSRVATVAWPAPAIDTDPVQEGEICLHFWMLYTPDAPVLNLRNITVTSQLDFQQAFQRLCLDPEEDKKQHNTDGQKGPTKDNRSA